MRPHKLTLEGFTSFRDKLELDFTGLDLFAITGPTGAGKSSLIDAICFALFGQSSGEPGVTCPVGTYRVASDGAGSRSVPTEGISESRSPR